MTKNKTAVTPDGRVLVVLQKDYRLLYAKAFERIAELEQKLREIQQVKDNKVPAGFGRKAKNRLW